jgi:hypothetical protein
VKPSVHLQEVATGRRWVGCCPAGPDPCNYIRLGSGDFLVGRHSTCEISLDDPSVSTSHAILRVVDDSLHIRDRGSRNGTFINDGRFRDWAQVRPGDLLRFGSAVVVVLWVGEGELFIRPEQFIWNDGTLVKLAATIKQGQSFADLPILADALEEAGVSDDVALATLRQARRSALTDYLLDQLLGSTGSAGAQLVQGRARASNSDLGI